MPEKLEEIMKKIHILLANCEPSTYSSEDVIVPKRRLFNLLEQLNYAVYEVMEQYEATVAARDRALIREERMAAEIREDAVQRAEDVYAASLLYTQDMLQDMKNITDYMYYKTRESYEELLQGYEERRLYMEQNEQELISQMSAMADAKTYLHIIEDRRRQKEAALKREAEEKAAKKEQEAKKEQAEQNEKKETQLQSWMPENKTPLLEEKKIYKLPQAVEEPDISDEEIDEYSAKLASQLVITVHDRPQVPEGFSKKKEKRAAKNKPELPDEEIQLDLDDLEEVPTFSAEELDKEYFDWQDSQNPTDDKEDKGKAKGLRILAKRKK